MKTPDETLILEERTARFTAKSVCNAGKPLVKSMSEQPDAGLLWSLPHRRISPGCFSCATGRATPYGVADSPEIQSLPGVDNGIRIRCNFGVGLQGLKRPTEHALQSIGTVQVSCFDFSAVALRSHHRYGNSSHIGTAKIAALLEPEQGCDGFCQRFRS
jgi:hypothetical protein